MGKEVMSVDTLTTKICIVKDMDSEYTYDDSRIAGLEVIDAYTEVLTGNEDLRIEVAKLRAAMPDPHKLDVLAGIFDKAFPNDDNPEVQNDLRKWAQRIREVM